MRRTADARGFTLVELVMFIVLVGIAFGALILAMNQFTRYSADPLQSKQALAVAESLLEEVELMPFTFCDPDDLNAPTATSAAGCSGGTAGSEEAGVNLGPESGENRYWPTLGTGPFDNVSDYNGFTMVAGSGAIPSGGIRDIAGNQVLPTGLENYSASVAVTRVGTTFIGGTAVSDDAVKISVTVTPPNGNAVTLEGYRARYAPNTAP